MSEDKLSSLHCKFSALIEQIKVASAKYVFYAGKLVEVYNIGSEYEPCLNIFIKFCNQLCNGFCKEVAAPLAQQRDTVDRLRALLSEPPLLPSFMSFDFEKLTSFCDEESGIKSIVHLSEEYIGEQNAIYSRMKELPEDSTDDKIMVLSQNIDSLSERISKDMCTIDELAQIRLTKMEDDLTEFGESMERYNKAIIDMLLQPLDRSKALLLESSPKTDLFIQKFLVKIINFIDILAQQFTEAMHIKADVSLDSARKILSYIEQINFYVNHIDEIILKLRRIHELISINLSDYIMICAQLRAVKALKEEHSDDIIQRTDYLINEFQVQISSLNSISDVITLIDTLLNSDKPTEIKRCCDQAITELIGQMNNNLRKKLSQLEKRARIIADQYKADISEREQILNQTNCFLMWWWLQTNKFIEERLTIHVDKENMQTIETKFLSLSKSIAGVSVDPESVLPFEEMIANIEALKVEIAKITADSENSNDIKILEKRIDDLKKKLRSKEKYVEDVQASKTIMLDCVDRIKNILGPSFPNPVRLLNYLPHHRNVSWAARTVSEKLKNALYREFRTIDAADQPSLDRVIKKYIPIIVDTNKIAKAMKYIGSFIQGNTYFQLQAKLLYTTLSKQNYLNTLFAGNETMQTHVEKLFSDLCQKYNEFNRRQREFITYVSTKLSHVDADLQTRDINSIPLSYFDFFIQMLESDEYIAMKKSYRELIAIQNELTQTRNNFAIQFRAELNRNLNTKIHAKRQSLFALILFTSLALILSSTFFTTISQVAKFKFIMQFIINNFLMTPIIFTLILPIAITSIVFIYNMYSINKINKIRDQILPLEDYTEEHVSIEKKSLEKAVATLDKFVSALENISATETKISLRKFDLEDDVVKETKVTVALENISVEIGNTIKYIRDFIQHKTNFQLQTDSLWKSYSEQNETLFYVIQESSNAIQELNKDKIKHIEKYQSLCMALRYRYNMFNYHQEEIIFYILDALQTRSASLISLSNFDTFFMNILDFDKHDEYVAMQESYRELIIIQNELVQARRDALVELQNVIPQLNIDLNAKFDAKQHAKRQSLLAFIISTSLALILSCTFFTTISQVAKFKFIMQFIINKFLIAPIVFTLILPIAIASIAFIYNMYLVNKTRNQILSLQSYTNSKLSQVSQPTGDRVEQPSVDQSELVV